MLMENAFRQLRMLLRLGYGFLLVLAAQETEDTSVISRSLVAREWCHSLPGESLDSRVSNAIRGFHVFE